MPRVSRNRPIHCGVFEIHLADDTELDADTKSIWVQVAREGQFAGYAGGKQPFEFTRETFQQIVKNLRSHPSFAKGPDGKGSTGVVPWDFNHASEQDPALGALPVGGAPAQGWTSDLEIRTGADSRAELWALTNWLEPARGYIQAGSYKWASVAVSFNTIHPVSGENVGAVLTSIAMTNQPFIEGMQQLAASRFGFFGEAAGSPSEALEAMRDLLALPATTGIDAVMAEVAKLGQWITVGNAPIGVDVGEIVANLRRILNLPALTEAPAVAEEAGRILEGLITEQAGDAGAPAPPADTEVPPAGQMMVSSSKENEMDLKILASKLGVRESDIADAIDDAVELRSKLKDVLKLRKSSNEVILQTVEETLDESSSVKDGLNSILQALGVEDPESALAALPTLMDAKLKLTEMLTELETAIGVNVDSETEAAEQDVEDLMSARKWDDEGMKFALTALRGLNFPVDENGKCKLDNRAKLAQLAAGRKVFEEKYPTPAPGRQDLLKSHVATRDGTQLSVSRDGTGVRRGTPAKSEALRGGGAQVISLAGYPGRNTTEKVMAWVRGNIDGADKMAREDVFTTACELKQVHKFEDPDAAVAE
jgi:hypothetical protein